MRTTCLDLNGIIHGAYCAFGRSDCIAVHRWVHPHQPPQHNWCFKIACLRYVLHVTQHRCIANEIPTVKMKFHGQLRLWIGFSFACITSLLQQSPSLTRAGRGRVRGLVTPGAHGADSWALAANSTAGAAHQGRVAAHAGGAVCSRVTHPAGAASGSLRGIEDCPALLVDWEGCGCHTHGRGPAAAAAGCCCLGGGLHHAVWRLHWEGRMSWAC